MNSGDELWRKCVDWLVAIGVLPQYHKTCDRSAQVFDLAQTLRDGVVLCNVLNVLLPGVIDDSQINRRAQMSEFLCMQNIRVVIYALENYFRIPKDHLFTAPDLYHMENFGQVIHALSYLSCLPQNASTFPSFQENSRLSRHRTSLEEEDIYRNLPDLASERALADEDEDLYDSVPEEKEEGIYGSLIDVKGTAPVSSSQKTDKRGCCIHEIVETENNYVLTLEIMVQQYMIPLREVLPESDLRQIFINIEQLRPIHSDFLGEFVRLQQNPKAAKFSEPFIKYMKKFLIYGDYCSKMADAQDLLDENMKNSENVKEKVNDCQRKSNRPKFNLRDLLCVPMQRVLKYHLLVKELNKHTPNDHIDKQSLMDALKQMQELSQYINEVKRDSEELIKINQIESRLDEYNGIPLHMYGRVQRDGELKVKYGDDRSNTRNIFLFDKGLFMTKMRNDSYILKDLIRLEDWSLDEMQSQKTSKAKWSFCFKLLSQTQGPSYTLYCKTEMDRTKWLEAFKVSFDNINPRALKGKKNTNTNFEMQTFQEPTQCDSCQELLKGIFYQGYKCSVTHARCHKRCLADTLKLIENNAIRYPHPATSPTSSDIVPPVPERGRAPKRAQPIPPQEPVKPPIATLSYKAHRDYSGTPAPPFQSAPIITFHIGQPIEVIEQVTSDWWKGRSFDNYDRIGYFPASFVSPQSQRQHRPSYCVAELKTSVPAGASPRKAVPSGKATEDMPWYAGEIDRTKAEQLLWERPTGTYLIRKKAPHGLVISLKFQKDVKHIKILQTDDNQHYVAECKNFASVQELVCFYQVNSLSGFFLGLETTLKFPYRDPVVFPGASAPPPTSPLSRPPVPHPSRPTRNGMKESVRVKGQMYPIIGSAMAKFDFEARSEQELSLRAGQLVNIISKAGGTHGWWKGERGGQVGYFPTSFVEE